tara:strand:+ start:1352 stop:2233 length:882 start_codon:yes stop_codon:yes gene_type:complete
MALEYYNNWNKAYKDRTNLASVIKKPTVTAISDVSRGAKKRIRSLVDKQAAADITFENEISVGQQYYNAFGNANDEYIVANAGRVVTRDPDAKVSSSALSDEALQKEMLTILSSGDTKRSDKGLDVRAKFDEMGHLMMNRYTKELGLTSFQAAALTGNAYHETGGFKYMDEQNPKVKGSAGGINLFQFTGLEPGLRRSNFEKFATEQELDPRDYKTGLTFSIYELTKGDQQNVLRMLRKTKTAEEANQIIVEKYLRPDPETMKMEERQRLTNEYASNYTTPEDFETYDPTDIQ